MRTMYKCESLSPASFAVMSTRVPVPGTWLTLQPLAQNTWLPQTPGVLPGCRRQIKQQRRDWHSRVDICTWHLLHSATLLSGYAATLQYLHTFLFTTKGTDQPYVLTITGYLFRALSTAKVVSGSDKIDPVTSKRPTGCSLHTSIYAESGLWRAKLKEVERQKGKSGGNRSAVFWSTPVLINRVDSGVSSGFSTRALMFCLRGAPAWSCWSTSKHSSPFPSPFGDDNIPFPSDRLFHFTEPRRAETKWVSEGWNWNVRVWE